MLRFLAPCGFALAPLFAMAAGSAAAPDWTQQPDHPLPPGMAGLIAGTHNGVVIAAGGANFPDKMPWEGGRKIYYDEIFVIAPGETVWRPAGKLPERRAYSAAVSVDGGVLVLGGENSDTVFQDSVWLRWDGKAVVIEKGPALPAPRTSQVAVALDGCVYAAGGYAPGAVRVSTGDFWRLDLARRDEGWQALPTWPGPTRAQGTIAAHDGAVYLLSGLELKLDAEGKAKPVYMRDAYRYQAGKWETLPEMPWSAIAAPSPAPVAGKPGKIFVLGGVDSRLVGKVPRDTRVPDHMLSFDLKAGAWTALQERWPDPVVTAPTVEIGGEWWILSGEIMAGVRTPHVWSWKPGAVR